MKMKNVIKYFAAMAFLIFIGCASTDNYVKKDAEQKPATARFDTIDMVYNSPDREIAEIQLAYANKNFDWLRSKLKGYLRVGNNQLLADVIHDSPGMSLRLLAVSALYSDSELFDQVYDIGLQNESDENSKRTAVEFKRVYYIDCGEKVFSQAMRSYFVHRRVNDIDFARIRDGKCRQSIKNVF
jgi:hypothetical protein